MLRCHFNQIGGSFLPPQAAGIRRPIFTTAEAEKRSQPRFFVTLLFPQSLSLLFATDRAELLAPTFEVRRGKRREREREVELLYGLDRPGSKIHNGEKEINLMPGSNTTHPSLLPSIGRGRRNSCIEEEGEGALPCVSPPFPFFFLQRAPWLTRLWNFTPRQKGGREKW